MSVETATEIRPFELEIPDEQFAELRRRIEATRWPSSELVDDRSQGVQLATMQALVRYWTTEYDFGRLEARLNALPQFTTEIDGVDIHFIHVRSPHEDALPLIMTHGWPGSVVELLETVGPLTDPTAHGGTPRTPSTWCCPPSPATASRESRGSSAGRGPHRRRLGGADEAARLHPLRRPGRRRRRLRRRLDGAPSTRRAVGIHLNVLAAAVALQDQLPAESEQERAAHEVLKTFLADGFAIVLEQSTRPQTIGYSLLDSPVGLAAWMLDHDTDSCYQVLPRVRRRQPRSTSPGQHRRRHHAVLADRHRRLGRPVVLGVQTSPAAAGAPARLRRRSRFRSATRLRQRGVPCPAQLGRGRFPRPRVLQRGRQGRSLRRLGGARALLHRGASAFRSLRR